MTFAQTRHRLKFAKIEMSLPSLEQPSASPYSQPDEFSQYIPILFVLRFIFYYPSISACLPNGPFL